VWVFVHSGTGSYYLALILFVEKIRQFAKYIFKKIFNHQFPVLFLKKKIAKKKIRQNLPQHKRMLKIFPLSHLKYCQIWLNILVDDRHKIGKKTQRE
jgi:hypothetical protein